MSEESISEILSSEADNVIIDDNVEVVETVNEVPAVTAETTEKLEETNEDVASREDLGLKQAAVSERKKRQDIQTQFDDLKREMQIMKGQNQAPVEPIQAPDAYMAPQDAIDHSSSQVSQDFTAKLLNMSESQARGRHKDFDEMKDLFFNEMSAANPNLQQQAMNAPDPYEFVYQQSKNHSELSGISNMSDYRAKVEAEVRASISAENETNTNAIANKAINDALPDSFAATTAIGGNQQPVVTHLSMEDILKR